MSNEEKTFREAWRDLGDAVRRLWFVAVEEPIPIPAVKWLIKVVEAIGRYAD